MRQCIITIKPNTRSTWGAVSFGGEEVPLPYNVADPILTEVMRHVSSHLRRPPRGSLAEAERAAVRRALHLSESYQGAADQLGCTPRTLFNMRKRYGLK